MLPNLCPPPAQRGHEDWLHNGQDVRLNNYENPYLFRDAMLKLLVETLPYAKLIED